MRIKEILNIDDFKEMFELEKKYYDEDHITPYEEAYKWHLEYPWSSKVLEARGRIVGFLDMFPIKNHIFEEIKSGQYNDVNLKADDILDITRIQPNSILSDTPIKMFLCCVVVDKKYRGTTALKDLLKAQIDFFEEYIKKGIKIDYIITDNVTDKGQGFSRKFGFEKIIDTKFESVIYMSKYENFVNKTK